MDVKLPDVSNELCQRCSQPIGAERLAARPQATMCAPCQHRAERLRGRPEVDDLRPRREGLPEALRRVEPLWEGD
jgi:RNA polymerase-binding transcription factor DksA